jgi:hypothetical protein
MPRHRLEPDGWDEAEEKIAQYLLLLPGSQNAIIKECIKLDGTALYSSLSHKYYLNQRQCSIKRSKAKFIQARNAGSDFHTTYQPLPEDFTPLQYIRPNKYIYQGITKGMFCQMFISLVSITSLIPFFRTIQESICSHHGKKDQRLHLPS